MGSFCNILFLNVGCFSNLFCIKKNWWRWWYITTTIQFSSVQFSCSVVSNSLRHHRLEGKNTGEGSHSLLQGIFPTQGSNPDLLHCRQILYHLSHRESESESEVAQSCPALCNPVDCSPPGSSIHGIFQARVLEWVAISFSGGFSWPRDWTGSPVLQADTLPSEPPGKGMLITGGGEC